MNRSLPRRSLSLVLSAGLLAGGLLAVPAAAADPEPPAPVPHPTGTVLAAIADGVADGDLTLTATVDSIGQGVPSGRVDFHLSDADGDPVGDRVGWAALVDEDAIGVGDDDATATATDVPAGLVGTRSYVATYVPDVDTWGGSVSDPVVATVTGIPVTVAVALDRTEAAVGDTVTATVTATAGGDPVPADPATSTIALGAGTPTAWGTGVTSPSVVTTAIGTHAVSVDFAPLDPTRYADPDAKSATVKVGVRTTTALDPVPPTAPDAGASLTLTAVVATQAAGRPAGTVVFSKVSGSTVTDLVPAVAVGPVTGQPHRATASKTIAAPASDAVSYRARFVPTNADQQAASVSTDHAVTPTKRTVVVTVVPPADPVPLGDDAVLTVKALYDGAAVPQNGSTVTVAVGSGTPQPVTGIVWSSTGTTSVRVPTSALGQHTVSVTYVPADTAVYTPPGAETATFTVTRPTDTELTGPSSTLKVQDQVPLRAVVSSATDRPVGQVVLYTVDEDGDLTPVDSEDLPTSGTDTTARSAAVSFGPAAVDGTTTYRTEFVPTDGAEFAPSEDDLAVTAEQAQVGVTVGVGATIPTGSSTFTVSATESGTGVGAGTTVKGASLTVKLDATTLPSSAVVWNSAMTQATVTVSPATTGPHTVKVTFVPDNQVRYAAPAEKVSNVVAKDPQAITASVTGPYYADGDLPVVVTGNETAASAVSTTPLVCSASTLTVTLLKPGACQLTVTAVEDETHLAGSTTVNLTVVKRPVTVALTVAPASPVYENDVVISATATGTGKTASLLGTGTLTVTRTGSPTPILSETYQFGATTPPTFTLTKPEVGTYTVAVDFTPDTTLQATYDEGSDSESLVVGLGTQAVAVAADKADHLFVGKTWTTPAKGSKSGTAATLEVLPVPGANAGDPLHCAVPDAAPTQLKLLSEGRCHVRMTVAATARYQQVVLEQTFDVALRSIDLQVDAAPADQDDTETRYDEPVTITVVATDGDADGTAGPVSGRGTVTVKSPAGVLTQKPLTLVAGTGTVTFLPAELAGHQVFVSVEEPAAVGGTATYAPLAAPATAQETFDVKQGRQPITWGVDDAAEPHDDPYLVDETWVPSAIGGGGPHTVQLTAVTEETCEVVDGTKVVVTAAPTPATAGTPVLCTVRAHQEGNTFYLDGDREETFEVTRRPVTVTLGWTADDDVFGDVVTITATATDDTTHAPVPDIDATDDDPAKRSGKGFIIVDGDRYPVTFRNGVATHPWTADTVGDHVSVSAEFDPTREDVFAVEVTDRNDLKIAKKAPGKLDPVNDPPTAPNIGDIWQPAAPSLGSGAPVTITVTSPTVCEVLGQPTDTGGQRIRFLTLDDCVYSITQAGDHHYLPATPYGGSIEVVKLVVRLVAVPPSDTEYGDRVEIGFTATGSKSGEPLAGELDLEVTDQVTGDVTDHHLEEDDGRFVLEIAAPGLLAGDYEVDATFDPEASDDYSPQTGSTTFEVGLRDQTAVLDPAGQDLAATQRVHATWTPTFAKPLSGEDVQLVVASGSAAEAQPAYEPGGRFHGDDSLDAVEKRWVAKPYSCVLSADRSTVTFVAEGPCRLQAVAPAVERMYDESPPAFTKAVRVEREAQSLTITPPGGRPTVGVRLRVKADARIGDPGVRAAAGRGPLTVIDPTGATVAGAPSAKEDWYGGNQFFNFTPRKAGTYQIDASFRSTDRFAYDWATVDPTQHTFEVLPGLQDLRLDSPPPTSLLVGQTWEPDVLPSPSGEPVEVRHVSGACSVQPATTGPTATPLTVTFNGVGACALELYAGATDDYLATPVALPVIQMEQTAVNVAVRTESLRVGTPATIFVAATSATDRRAVEGTGTVGLEVDGITVPEADVVRSAWTNGEQRISWTPTTAAHDLDVDVDFTPASSSYTPVRGSAHPLPVASGVQQVRIGTEPDTAVYVGETWKPLPTGTAAPGASVIVTASPAARCRVSGTGATTEITYLAAGPCTVKTSLPQLPATVAGGLDPDWTGAERTDVIQVAAHPSTLSLTLPPATELYFGRPLVLRAQVVGRVGNAGTPQPVEGTVQFTYDGDPLEPDADPDADPDPDPAADRTQVELVDGWAEITVTLTEDDVEGTTLTYEHAFAAVFTPKVGEETYWIYAPGGTEPQTASISLKQSAIVEPATPTSLRIGQTWTSGVDLPGRDPGDLVMGLRPGDETACTVDPGARTVTVRQVTSDGQQCEVRYHAATDGRWAAASEARQPITIVRHPTDVAVSATNTPTAGGPLGLQALVVSPGVAETATTTGLLETVPAGEVEFFVGGDSVGKATADAGRATLSVPVAPRAGELPIRAVFTPAGGAASSYATGTSPAKTVTVAPAPTTTGPVTIADGRLRASVSRTLQPVPPIGGEIEFSYQPMVDGGAWTTIGSAEVVAGTAVLEDLPPATQEVRLRARYVGDGNHVTSTGSTTERLLPTITWSLTSGSSTGWNGQTVRVAFTCTPPTGVLLDGSCPAPYEFTSDGRGQSVTGTVRARNGGQRSVTVSGINVDRTAPTVTIGGVAPGVRYRGSTPRALCHGSDALSGVASCTITRSPLGGDRYRDTAVVVDRAGNRGTARVDFQILDEWIGTAPLVGGGFQVKQRTKQRLVVRTDGPQPQLMLPDKKGTLRPSKVLRASKVAEGYVTWFVDVTVPRSVRNGRSWRIGYRLIEDRSVQVVRMRLDVVRKPAAGDRRRR